jgi:hypothetical protein
MAKNKSRNLLEKLSVVEKEREKTSAADWPLRRKALKQPAQRPRLPMPKLKPPASKLRHPARRPKPLASALPTWS